jgi:Icc-related predicted phosphoesterase
MADGSRFKGVVLVGVIAALAALLAPAGALAVKAPGLASSAQYKAFIEYVTKMEERSTTPTSTETKDTFEAKLTAKETAAKHKANALFKRASEETKAEANESATEQAERVRNKEEEAQEELNLETAGRLERAESSYHQKYEKIATGHKNREKALKGQIAELRKKKAAAAPGAPKEKIQERISAKSAEVAANRTDEKNERQELKSATGKQKKQIKTTAEAKEAEIAEAAEETVKKIDAHWNKQYLEKKAALNATRENRIGYLESKLEQGRAAIAAMPTT